MVPQVLPHLYEIYYGRLRWRGGGGHAPLQVAHDPRCSKSGVYWSWNGGPREGRGEEALEKDGQILGGGGAGGGWDSIYENDQSDKVLNKQTAEVSSAAQRAKQQQRLSATTIAFFLTLTLSLSSLACV